MSDEETKVVTLRGRQPYQAPPPPPADAAESAVDAETASVVQVINDLAERGAIKDLMVVGVDPATGDALCFFALPEEGDVKPLSLRFIGLTEIAKDTLLNIYSYGLNPEDEL